MPIRAWGPSPNTPISTAPASASTEDAVMIACHGQSAPTIRKAWGSAVPRVSIDTS
ncbi:hypothetical protein LOY65_10185 [Pseudomonas corrugata]|nr:hypothetical protein [Pseudomonas corrugata]UZE08260.1 hypothetical protein LOY65_10185 [Pseudomonas corrugata]